MWYRVVMGSAVFVDERKSRAGHVLGAGGSEAFCDAFYQGRLPRPEVTAQQHDKRRRQFGGQLPAERDRLLGGVCGDLDRHPERLSIATSRACG